MTSTVLLEYSGGETAQFDTEPYQTIVEGADQAEIPIAFSCLSGVCRACVAEDIQTGEQVLLCQTRTDADAHYRLPYSRAAASVRPTKRRAKLEQFDKVSPSVFHLTYRLEFPITFLPGQYASIAVPAPETGLWRQSRYFSMSSDPNDGKRLSFYVRNLPDGHISTYLSTRAKREDMTTIAAPRGAFYLREDTDPKLFVAGGTGLSPMLSMLKALKADQPDCEATLIFGITKAADIFALDELEELSCALSNLEIVYTVMDGSIPGLKQVDGTVVDGMKDLALQARLSRAKNAYLCGPPAMVNAICGYLADVMPEDAVIHNEVFSATDAL